MSESSPTREELEQSIAALEAQRHILGAAAAAAAPALAALRSQLKAISDDSPGTEDQRKHITILFADVQGFTAMSGQMDPEDVAEVMNSLWARIDQVIVDHGGRVDKHIGDAVMIFFGDPEARGRKEDALACVRMAIRTRERARQLRDSWADVIGPQPLHIRLGINTGYCTVGNFGSEDRLDYTIVGGAVNVASRLEETAGPDQIQISHTTYALVKNQVYCRPIGDIRVKGVSHELRTYEVVGEFGTLHPKDRIEAATEGFNLLLDPSELNPYEADRARHALESALKALGGPSSDGV